MLMLNTQVQSIAPLGSLNGDRTMLMLNQGTQIPAGAIVEMETVQC